MKIINKPKPIPSSIYKLAASTPEPFALFIFLDSVPYCEIKSMRLAEFTEKLFSWKRDNSPSLKAPVNVRFFIRTSKDLQLQEVRL